MLWNIDKRTEDAARTYELSLRRKTPAPQFPGCLTDGDTWNDRVVQPALWPSGLLWSSPDQILTFFREGRYTQALAMVVSWGGMGRRSLDIYRDRSPQFIEHIEGTLRDCAQNIKASDSIEPSWSALTGLGKRAVGLTLHFLCRSLGFTQDPPAVIDNKVMRKRVWPLFRDSIPPHKRADNWEGDTFSAYSRYMTAVLTWAGNIGWTTIEMECTIFDQYLNDKQSAC